MKAQWPDYGRGTKRRRVYGAFSLLAPSGAPVTPKGLRKGKEEKGWWPTLSPHRSMELADCGEESTLHLHSASWSSPDWVELIISLSGSTRHSLILIIQHSSVYFFNKDLHLPPRRRRQELTCIGRAACTAIDLPFLTCVNLLSHSSLPLDK